MHALNKQFNRYHGSTTYNSTLSSSDVIRHIKLDKKAKEQLDKAASFYHLSARSYFKIIKVAQTIADIDFANPSLVQCDHILEALSYKNALC